MSRITLEVNSKQLMNSVEKLSLKEKIELARKLTQETWKARFGMLLSRLDRRMKSRQPLATDEIIRTVKRVRKRLYAQCNH